ncbi:hypothetical protein DY000_02013589 [Brassica cretica]|uniref:F-box associated domain-containing protein n=1 Tax=Brassica cretica TaxID=69181 RepID=A0ABQ7CQB2_BRACR|nr:hypothetical protein DY000_02013589 [Brassica cretica]
MVVFICPTTNRVVSISHTVDASVDRFVVGSVGRFRIVCVHRRNWMSVDRFRVVRFVLGSTVASCNDSDIIDSSGDRLWLLDLDRVVVGIKIDEC